MRKPAFFIAATSAVAIILATSSVTLPQLAIADASLIAKGKKIAENRKKGNCFTCHQYEGAIAPGNMGPPLVAMKARFPDKAKLRDQIADPTKANPATVMPPFGKHEVLSKDEINAIVEWVYSL